MPRVNIDGYQALSRGSNRQGDMTTNLQGQFNVTQVRGEHTLRGGVDIRKAMRFRAAGGNNSGAFNFTRDYTRQASDESALTASNLGLSLAAFDAGRSDVDPDGRSGGGELLQPLRRRRSGRTRGASAAI